MRRPFQRLVLNDPPSTAKPGKDRARKNRPFEKRILRSPGNPKKANGSKNLLFVNKRQPSGRAGKKQKNFIP
jgi:hypothetical protein